MPRITNSLLKTALENNDPFVYAHLIKFERPRVIPSTNDTLKIDTDASKYAYITDGAYNISFDDGTTDLDGNANGAQVYVANKVFNFYVKDPSNQADQFQRARLRKLITNLTKEGFDFKKLNLTIKNLASTNQAMNELVVNNLNENVIYLNRNKLLINLRRVMMGTANLLLTLWTV